ncbi:uncharacterized protein LOC114533637 [Dendronephthya gigantea]|uniref:uncharacterized protein LOC114533637 n=1 Tax=Dendronephthya gigantea TaxID=151771 RepID=UPI00106C187F|nr:uncharacterized protein LOC114533637 [Dendronephthya gigantea]
MKILEQAKKQSDGGSEIETNELLGNEVERQEKKNDVERKKDGAVKIPKQEEGKTHPPKQETFSGLKESTSVIEAECDTNTSTHPPVMQPMNTNPGPGESKMQNSPQLSVNLSVTAAVTVNGV